MEKKLSKSSSYLFVEPRVEAVRLPLKLVPLALCQLDALLEELKVLGCNSINIFSSQNLSQNLSQVMFGVLIHVHV